MSMAALRWPFSRSDCRLVSWVTRLRSLVAAPLVALLAGCGRDTAPPRDTVATRDLERPLWFREARAIDLTEDGKPDSAVVEARGERSDSLRIRILFVVDGQVLFTQEWASAYELTVVDSLQRRPHGSDEYMRSQLAGVLEAVRVRPLDTSFVRDFGGDTAVLRLARRSPIGAVRVAYGYETTMSVVWDRDARRFRIAHSCC